MTENLPQKQVQGRFQEAICNKRSYNKLEKANKLITTYHDEINKKNILRLRELLNTLPSFCSQYFRGIQEYTSSRTRVAYAYDIRIFFEYLHDSNPIFKKTPIREYRLEILDQITRIDIEEYLEHCSYYTKDGKEYMNDERGKARNCPLCEASTIIFLEMK